MNLQLRPGWRATHHAGWGYPNCRPPSASFLPLTPLVTLEELIQLLSSRVAGLSASTGQLRSWPPAAGATHPAHPTSGAYESVIVQTLVSSARPRQENLRPWRVHAKCRESRVALLISPPSRPPLLGPASAVRLADGVPPGHAPLLAAKPLPLIPPPPPHLPLWPSPLSRVSLSTAHCARCGGRGAPIADALRLLHARAGVCTRRGLHTLGSACNGVCTRSLILGPLPRRAGFWTRRVAGVGVGGEVDITA